MELGANLLLTQAMCALDNLIRHAQLMEDSFSYEVDCKVGGICYCELAVVLPGDSSRNSRKVLNPAFAEHHGPTYNPKIGNELI